MNQNTPSSTYLASKPRYEILDGLRGVAAIIVVAFHLFETYSGGAIHQIINHGYLAVDFFFILSGFVIGYAYDDRWDKMTLTDFLKRRLVRLHPMVIMGTLIGACLFYLGESSAFPLISQTSGGKALFLTILGCLMIPVGRRLDIRGWSEINSFNGASWSLMWEYVANLLYALVIRHFSRTLLIVFVLLAALLNLNLTLNYDIFGLFAADRTGNAYTVIGGWSLAPDQFFIGLSRLLYPFFMGLLLSRINKLIRINSGFWWCTFFIAVLLMMPRIGGETHLLWNGIYESICILLLFPMIVLTGAGSTVSHPYAVRICKFLGDISYPLYITHYPFIYLQITYATNHPDASLSQSVFLAIGIFLMAFATAYASLKLYDEPVRAWLRDHWFIRRTALKAALQEVRVPLQKDK